MKNIAFFFHTVCFPVELSSLILGFNSWKLDFVLQSQKRTQASLVPISKDNNLLQSIKFSPVPPITILNVAWNLKNQSSPETKDKCARRLSSGEGVTAMWLYTVVAMFLHSWHYNGMPSHIPSPLACGPQIPCKPWWTRGQQWSLYLTRLETIWLLGDVMDFFRQMWF